MVSCSLGNFQLSHRNRVEITKMAGELSVAARQ